MKEKILVTGGAGYLGSIMVPALLKEGYEVTVLDNFMYHQNSLAECCADPAFSVFRGDCRNEELMKKLIADKDIIIPLAALVGAPLCAQDEVGAVSIGRDAVRMLCRIASPLWRTKSRRRRRFSPIPPRSRRTRRRPRRRSRASRRPARS